MNDVMSVDITENSIGASPLQLTVDVVGDQVVVSGGGVVATFSWRVEGDAAAKRFAAQPMDHGPDANAENSFRVVLVDSPAQVVAERLTREQADELVRRITEGIKVQLGASSEGVNDKAPTPEPMTLKDYALVAAGMVGCLVLGIVLIVAPFVALYYFLKSVGLDGAANVLVNTGVLAIVMGVVIACLAMPFISLVRLVQAFQGGHRS